MTTTTLSAAALLHEVQRLAGVRDAQAAKVRLLGEQVAQLEAETQILTHCGAAFEALLKLASEESVESVEQLVTYGLKTVFEDLDLRFKLTVETKRGLQWMEPTLIDGVVTAPILDAFGGGPASVVAFLLRLMVCRRLRLAPLILLDESFSFLSEQYVDPMARLLRELADRVGVTLVLVTHHRGYLASATRAYEARESSEGTRFVPV